MSSIYYTTSQDALFSVSAPLLSHWLQLLTVYYIVLIFAFTDKFYQMAFQMMDLLLDALGTALGLGAYVLCLRRSEVKGSRFMQRM